MAHVDQGLLALERGRFRTPCLLLDPSVIEDRVRQLRSLFDGFAVHYAVKCNSSPTVLHAVHDAGGTFEVASEGELKLLKSLGLLTSEVLFSAPVKRPAAIQLASELGIEWFASASEQETQKILDLAPDASILVRVAVNDTDARWRLSDTWGVTPDRAVEMLSSAKAVGANRLGLMFHVGSQNRAPEQWRDALTTVADVMERFDGRIDMVDIGGGLPANTREEKLTESWPAIGAAVTCGIAALPYRPDLLVAEPGRAVVAEAGTMYATVIEAAERDGQRWVHLDVGAFNGLFEGSPQGGGIPYEIRSFGRDIEVLEPATVGGITCDAQDIIAVDTPVPVDLMAGEIVAIPNAGAYSTSYASAFCGIGVPDTLRYVTYNAEPPAAAIAWEADFGFKRAVEIEFEVFENAGFLDEDGTLDGFRRFDRQSEFVMVPSTNDPVGVARLVDASAFGFMTLGDMKIEPRWWEHLQTLNLDRVVELATLAPLNYSVPAAMHLIRATIMRAVERDMTHVVASIDENLRVTINKRLAKPDFAACEQIGPTVDYYGSPTTPILVDLCQGYRTGLVEALDRLVSRLALPEATTTRV
ncbi:MAG: ornithine decarboxylase [Candidatus Aldehydirespiratoraceae bacterium]|jgi:ornithine decarboxylase